MPLTDLSVNVTVYNQTNQYLRNGVTSVIWGYWADFKAEVKPKSEVNFEIRNNSEVSGSEGTFTYDLRDESDPKAPHVVGRFSAYQTDPYSKDPGNIIRITTIPPQAVYNVYFKARVWGEGWTLNSVKSTGHPVWVRYYLTYRDAPIYKCKLLNIRSSSAHPIRNSRGDLIKGDHLLYDSSNPSHFPDRDRGSFEPNVFNYDFTSEIPSPIMEVTIKAVDQGVIGAEASLYAIESDAGPGAAQAFVGLSDFTFGKDPVTVPVKLYSPSTSDKPFVFNDTVMWVVELKQTLKDLKWEGNHKTRLELYWIAETRHPAFGNYIPVEFLRGVLPYHPTPTTVTSTMDGGFYQQMTRIVFTRFHKKYDTVSGMSWYGLDVQGGNFKQSLYVRESDPNSREHAAGSFCPRVSCMDQAAMIELACSLLGGESTTSWLYQRPFGYIKDTHLVGLDKTVNNPFYGTLESNATLEINDIRRTPFDLYVYVGHSNPFNPDDDGIYDGCTGPYLGTQLLADYLGSTIDKETTLYKTNPAAGPGSKGSVRQGQGVLTIDEGMVFSQSHTMIPLTEPLSHLFNTAVGVAPTAGPLMYVGWAHLPTWLNATLGNTWKIDYEQLSVSETGAQALWVISDANAPKSPIHVNVKVISVVTEGGHLDMVESAAVVKESIVHILTSTQRHDVWTSGTLPNFKGASLQYADHIEAGRIVLIAGNIIMDIIGMTSIEALLPYALKLFNQTVRHDAGHLDRSLPAVPVLRRQPEAVRIGADTITGIDTRFSLVFSVNCKIATANAGSEGYGILYDRHIVKEVDNGEGCTVEFFFIAAKIGRHRVRVCVADLETMVGAKADLEVEVVGAEEKCEPESGKTNTDVDGETESCEN